MLVVVVDGVVEKEANKLAGVTVVTNLSMVIPFHTKQGTINRCRQIWLLQKGAKNHFKPFDAQCV
jgi:hypothetical protein